jgi:hypothetical protein
MCKKCVIFAILILFLVWAFFNDMWLFAMTLTACGIAVTVAGTWAMLCRIHARIKAWNWRK